MNTIFAKDRVDTDQASRADRSSSVQGRYAASNLKPLSDRHSFALRIIVAAEAYALAAAL
jgi:hypothetical protein